jgi:hypothetical protein
MHWRFLRGFEFSHVAAAGRAAVMFYTGWNSPMHLSTTHIGIGPGISGLGGPGFSGSSGTGCPSSVRPNGIGAPACRSIPMITPVGNGASAPMGMYGGSCFGSSAGGAVR